MEFAGSDAGWGYLLGDAVGGEEQEQEQELRARKSVWDPVIAMEGQSGGKVVYPVVASQYKLLEEIGYGLGSTVHRAICLLYNEVVAVKTLDLESGNANLV